MELLIPSYTVAFIILSLAKEDWHMPIESYQFLLTLFVSIQSHFTKYNCAACAFLTVCVILPFDGVSLPHENNPTERLNKRIVNDNMEDSEGVPYGIPVSFINTIADHIVEVFDISHVNDILSQFDHFQTVIGTYRLL